jgi:large subunit ribosomal protein L32e
MSVKSLTELPGLKEEHLAQLAELGIKSVADMKKALGDDAQVKAMIKVLSGVGPKTVDKWKAELDSVEKPAKDVPKEPAKATSKDRPKEDKKVEIVEAEDGKDAYRVKIKPELDDEMKDALAKRALISGRRPAFKRQEWFRYPKLGEKWRKPKGIHSKMKRKLDRRPPVVLIGYRGPAVSRGLHPSGFEEVLVSNVSELDGIDPKKQAVRIGGTVGTRKRIMIEDRAEELGIRVLNRMV